MIQPSSTSMLDELKWSYGALHPLLNIIGYYTDLTRVKEKIERSRTLSVSSNDESARSNVGKKSIEIVFEARGDDFGQVEDIDLQIMFFFLLKTSKLAKIILKYSLL